MAMCLHCQYRCSHPTSTRLPALIFDGVSCTIDTLKIIGANAGAVSSHTALAAPQLLPLLQLRCLAKEADVRAAASRMVRGCFFLWCLGMDMGVGMFASSDVLYPVHIHV